MPARRRKVSKASVNYRAGDENKRCGNCVMFHPLSGTCDLVRGSLDTGDPIQEGMVCDEWEAK